MYRPYLLLVLEQQRLEPRLLVLRLRLRLPELLLALLQQVLRRLEPVLLPQARPNRPWLRLAHRQVLQILLRITRC
jgi:hypothetical protein